MRRHVSLYTIQNEGTASRGDRRAHRAYLRRLTLRPPLAMTSSRSVASIWSRSASTTSSPQKAEPTSVVVLPLTEIVLTPNHSGAFQLRQRQLVALGALWRPKQGSPTAKRKDAFEVLDGREQSCGRAYRRASGRVRKVKSFRGSGAAVCVSLLASLGSVSAG